MAVSNYNIKQITNYDISGYPTINYSITFPNGDVKTVPYITALDGSQIVKLGYCCEPKGIELPIYIKTNDGKGYREIQVGKTGMYEMQPELWHDINKLDTEKEETTVIVTGVRVPERIEFTLDYVLTIN